ncbi:hypothetical protein KCP73_14245 [Salmonella enterica subsp. enterica]|nr:hypothetical protein KCP73_14245 [Salmonella enterica subsp. enterica]
MHKVTRRQYLCRPLARKTTGSSAEPRAAGGVTIKRRRTWPVIPRFACAKSARFALKRIFHGTGACCAAAGIKSLVHAAGHAFWQVLAKGWRGTSPPLVLALTSGASWQRTEQKWVGGYERLQRCSPCMVIATSVPENKLFYNLLIFKNLFLWCSG